jgi:hypothetical protein
MSDKPLLKWVSHPFGDYPKNSIFLVVFLIVFAILLWRITVISWEMPIFYYIGMLVIVMSLITYFVPTTYILHEDNIEVYYWFIRVSRPYSDFGCYYEDKKGVMLSTFKRPSRLDPFRGLSLRFSKTQEEKEKMLDILDEKIGNKV